MSRSRYNVWPRVLPVWKEDSYTIAGHKIRGFKTVGIGIHILNMLGLLGKLLNMQFERLSTGYRGFLGGTGGGGSGHSGDDAWELLYLGYLKTNAYLDSCRAYASERNGAIQMQTGVYARLEYNSTGAWTALSAWTLIDPASSVTSLNITNTAVTGDEVEPVLLAVRISGAVAGTSVVKFDLVYIPTSVVPD